MQSLFKIFIRNIMLTEAQEEDARSKYTGVCKTLHDRYYPDSEYNGSTKLITGSYGKSTNIRPPRDIDVIFKMPDDEFTRFNNVRGNKQSQLLQEIRSALKDTYTTTEAISAFGKVVVVRFAEGTHTVELLPGWKLTDGQFRIPNTENGGSWEIWDPVAEIERVRSSNGRTGLTLDLIRVCKKWAEYCNVSLESFIIELLVVEYLDGFSNDSPGMEYSRLVAEFFSFLLSKKNTDLVTASGKVVNLGDEWESRVLSAQKRIAKAIEFEEECDIDKAADEWKKLFGDDFPKAEGSTKRSPLSEGEIAVLRGRYPSRREEFLERDCGIGFRINPIFDVSIDAEIAQDGFRPARLTHFIQRGYPLKKFKRLVFFIDKNSVPAPYSIKWKVRNFGEEASRADDLRGEISADKGHERKEERTKYYGEHYVECYIIKDNVCVGLDRILVPIGNNY